MFQQSTNKFGFPPNTGQGNLSLPDVSEQKTRLLGAGKEGTVAAALAGLCAVIDHSISDERVRAAGTGDVSVTLRQSRSILRQDVVELRPPIGIQNTVVDGCDFLTRVAIEEFNAKRIRRCAALTGVHQGQVSAILSVLLQSIEPQVAR